MLPEDCWHVDPDAVDTARTGLAGDQGPSRGLRTPDGTRARLGAVFASIGIFAGVGGFAGSGSSAGRGSCPRPRPAFSVR